MAVRPRLVPKRDLEASRALERFARDADWFDASLPRLKKRFPGHWVAVFDGKIVGSDLDVRKLIASLRERGFDPGHCFLRSTRYDEVRLRLGRTGCFSAEG